MNDARAWWIDVMPEATNLFDHEDSTVEIQGLEDQFGIVRALAKWAIAHGLLLEEVEVDGDDGIIAMAYALPGADGEVAVNVFFESMD
jgi:hypothetical protein